MPDGYGRMTGDEASPQLKRFLFGDGSKTCAKCATKQDCPFRGQVCAMFKQEIENDVPKQYK